MSLNPLKILTVADVPPDPNSGAAGTIYHTNVALRKLGHEVDEIWSHDLGYHRIQHGNLHSLLEQPWAYRQAVIKAVQYKEYDVIQMSQPQAYLAAKALKKNGFKGLVINRSHGVEIRLDEVLPYWHQKLGIPESRFPEFITRGLKRLLQRQWHEVVKYSDGIIVTCEDDRDCLLRRLSVKSSQIRVIHHGVPDQYLTAPLQPYTLERLNRLLYVGQSVFFKGVVLLVEIVNQVLRENPEVTMTWVTNASVHAKLISQLAPDIRSRVEFLDWQSQDKLIELYDHSGIFIFPSLVEGAGKTSLEAMSRGLCVVASNQGGMKDYIKSGQSGFLFQVGELNQCIDSVQSMLNNYELAKQVSQYSSVMVQDKSWLQCSQNICSFYDDLNSQSCPKT